ncbi:hypothetical protein M885DRAFT_557116 [Pelagophyceae sp. CCMP2097]|nr:hypothetical protein M885DRAFT_557116 [Pelagophyceae sp. CCMP2097]|mmetsp:Transcript_2483/g.9056  ORF Transcript_2483/g.9056 Transcript_2483/m.9056 type:complete len:197 (-) Transcript_2483:4-594(-)
MRAQGNVLRLLSAFCVLREASPFAAASRGRLSTALKSAAPGPGLEGRTHKVTLDFGRETGTWMPPRWASSGRAEYSLLLTWRAYGLADVSELKPLRGNAMGSDSKWKVQRATWAVDGSTLRVALDHAGLSVGDIYLKAGTVDLALPIFGGQKMLSAKEGLMSIVAYRFFVRKERRLVGTWRATQVIDAAPAASLPS